MVRLALPVLGSFGFVDELQDVAQLMLRQPLRRTSTKQSLTIDAGPHGNNLPMDLSARSLSLRPPEVGTS